MAVHSHIGASSMYRWMACPGSIREIRKAPPAPTTPEAQEGTDAHALAAHCLINERVAYTYVDRDFTYEDDGVKRTIEITKEMAEAVDLYCDTVRSRIEYPEDILLVEVRFDLGNIHPGAFGTADAVVYRPSQRRLIVTDLKYGSGILVHVFNNPQLKYYALGALLCGRCQSERWVIEDVELCIVQPRMDHPDGPIRSQILKIDEIFDFAVDLKRYAKLTEDPDAPLAAGVHCRFCSAAAFCPELKRSSQALAKVEFSPVNSYDPYLLAQALEKIPQLQAWINSTHEFAYAVAERGDPPPGWKLVAKEKRRRYRNPEEVVESFKDLGIAEDAYLEPKKLKPLTQLEKIIGKKAMALLTMSVSSGHVLVPEHDPRPALKPPAQQEFTALNPPATEDPFE